MQLIYILLCHCGNLKNLGIVLCFKIFPVAQTVKNLPAVQETWVQSLGWEDTLEEGMATHSNILAWRIPMDQVAWQATVHGSQRIGHD